MIVGTTFFCSTACFISEIETSLQTSCSSRPVVRRLCIAVALQSEIHRLITEPVQLTDFAAERDAPTVATVRFPVGNLLLLIVRIW